MFSPIPCVVLLGAFFGGWEIVLIFAVIVVLLGAKRLPDIAKGLGDGLHHFRKEIDGKAHEAGESLGGIYGKPAAEALTPDNQNAELYDPDVFRQADGKPSFRQRLRALWQAILRCLRITH